MLRIFKQYYPIRNVFFVMGEGVAIYLSVLLASRIILGAWVFTGKSWWYLNMKIVLITTVCQTCLYYNDLYNLKVTATFWELAIRLLQALGATAILLSAVYYFVPYAIIGKGIFVISIGFVIVFIVSWRFCYTMILNRGMFNQNIIILGSWELARNIIEEINTRKDCGYKVAVLILECRGSCLNLIENHSDVPKPMRVLTKDSCRNLCEIAHQENVQKIIVAIKERRGCFPTKELLDCRVTGFDIIEGNSFYETLTGKLSVDHINPGWLIFSEGFRKSLISDMLKRLFDIVISFGLLVILLPLIAITTLMIKLDRREPELEPKDIWRWFRILCKEDQISVGTTLREIIGGFVKFRKPDSEPADMFREFAAICAEQQISMKAQIHQLVRRYIRIRESKNSTKHPAFFSQERMGKDGKNYRMYKFRSMIVNAEKISGPVWAGENDRRITRIGNFIRKTRIDEIPQLWNVLKGEMSFVGPRPEREHFVKQLEKTIPYYRQRLTVKPGMTGWAQVSYGYGASEDDAKEKLNYDLFYIKNMSFLMDIMIVLKTVKIVIFGKGR